MKKLRTLEKIRNPVCGVFAVTLATRHSFDFVMNHFRDKYNKAPQWKGRLSYKHLTETLADFDINYKPIITRGVRIFV